MLYAQMLFESGFEAVDVVVAMFAPTVGGSVCRVANLQIGY